MIMKTNFTKLAGLSLFSLLAACGIEEYSGTKENLEANRPVWVPEGSTLMYGVDGSVWANCNWQGDIYNCAFYEIDRNAKVEQSYQFCSLNQSSVLVDRPAQSWLNKYSTTGLFFLPVSPPIYYEANDKQEMQKSDEEYRALDFDVCSMKFLPSEGNKRGIR